MSEGENPKISIEVDAETARAEKKLKALEERVKAQQAVYNTLNRRARQQAKETGTTVEEASKRAQKANKDRAKSAERAAKQELKWLHRTRWDIITVMFYYRLLAAAARAAFKLISEAQEQVTEREGIRVLGRMYGVDIGPIAQQFREISGGVLGVRESLQAVQQGILQDQGQFVDRYAQLWRAAMLVARISGEDATDMFSTFLEALAEGDAEILDSQTNLYQARLAVQKYAESVGVAADELDPAVRSQIIFNSIMQETTDIAAAGGDALLDQSDGLAAVATSWQTFRSVLGGVGKELLETGSGLETINDLLMTMSQVTILLSANMAHFRANIELLQPGRVPLGVGPPALIAGRAIWSLIRGPEEGEETPEEAYNRVFRSGIEMMGIFRDEVEETNRTYERFREQEQKETDYGALADHLMERQDLFDEHAKRVQDIEDARTQRIERIERDHQKAVLRIHRNAFQDRLKAARDYSRRVRKETAQFNLREKQEREDHLRDLRHAEEQYRLDRLHDMRLYNYERMMLVAEGDVLAIEDLDARYELEQRAAEENQDLKQRQRREDYEAERQQRREQFDLELQEMQDAYEERLREISIREQELLDEQITKRMEALQEAQRIYDEDIEQERQRHQESLTEWNEYWVTLAERTELGATTITNILNRYFGPSGEADTIVQDFMDRWTTRQRYLTQLESMVPQPSADATVQLWQTPPIGYSEEVAGYWQYSGRNRRYQHGGSGVVRRPTPIWVGEGHTPERFSVEPAAGAGLHMTLSWAGGPIPLQGSGLEGANLGGLGDAITQGLVAELVSQVRSARR